MSLLQSLDKLLPHSGTPMLLFFSLLVHFSKNICSEAGISVCQVLTQRGRGRVCSHLRKNPLCLGSLQWGVAVHAELCSSAALRCSMEPRPEHVSGYRQCLLLDVASKLHNRQPTLSTFCTSCQPWVQLLQMTI